MDICNTEGAYLCAWVFLCLAPRPARKETELEMVVATPSQTSWPQSSSLSALEAISETFGF